MKRILLFLSLVSGLLPLVSGAQRPNLLIITVDDMSCDSVGAFGCKLKGTTPHMDLRQEQSDRAEKMIKEWFRIATNIDRLKPNQLKSDSGRITPLKFGLRNALLVVGLGTPGLLEWIK